MTTHFNSYTYLIVRKSDRMMYHGSRKIKGTRTPEQDLGYHYFGTSLSRTDNLSEQASVLPESFEFYILTKHCDYEDAVQEEIRFHAEQDVAHSQYFSNDKNAGKMEWAKLSEEAQERQKARSSETMKNRHADPEFAKANSARMKNLNADPEFAKAHSARMKNLHADPEFAKANSERGKERMKNLHADPEFAKANSERGKLQGAKRNTSGFTGVSWDSTKQKWWVRFGSPRTPCGYYANRYHAGAISQLLHDHFQVEMLVGGGYNPRVEHAKNTLVDYETVAKDIRRIEATQQQK